MILPLLFYQRYGIEPLLQPLSGEQLHYGTVNVEDCAHLDISAESFWCRDRRLAYFDIKVLKTIMMIGFGKWRGNFSPLVFSSSNGMGLTATVVYKRIATLISEKRGHPYCHVLYWIRC